MEDSDILILESNNSDSWSEELGDDENFATVENGHAHENQNFQNRNFNESAYFTDQNNRNSPVNLNAGNVSHVSDNRNNQIIPENTTMISVSQNALLNPVANNMNVNRQGSQIIGDNLDTRIIENGGNIQNNENAAKVDDNENDRKIMKAGPPIYSQCTQDVRYFVTEKCMSYLSG